MSATTISSRTVRVLCLSALVVALTVLNGSDAPAVPGAGTGTSATGITPQDHVAVTPPPALQTYAKTPTHAKRKATYAKTWDDPKADLKYDDGSKQTIQLVKSPFDRVLKATIKTRPKGKKKTTPDKEYAGWVTSTQKVEMTATSSTFLNNDYADADANIYPGAIFGAWNYEHGDYKAQQGKRNPIQIVTDNPNIDGASSVNVKQPSVATIRTAVATLYHRMRGKPATDGFSSQTYESSNTSSMALQVSGGASFFGVSASDAFHMSQKSSSLYLTVDATLPLFSISAIPSDQGYFADHSVENTPDLMVVSNVVYGVRVLANVTVTFNSTQAADDFHAGLNWGVVTASALSDYMTKHSDTVSTLNAYVIGGNAGNAAGLVTLDPKSFMRSIKDVFKGATFANARPISYQLSDMADDIVEAQSLCNFTTISSGPKSYNPKIAFIDCSFLSGSDGKDNDTNLNVYLYPPSYPPNSQVDDMVGAIYGYQSQGHSWAFGGGQVDTVPLIPGDGVHSRGLMTENDLIKQNGGRVRIHIYPNGNDTWDITQATLYLHLDDQTLVPIQLSAGGKPNFVISQDVTTYDLTFTGKDIN
jgi:hypothetical protein